jgi:hypothetical protein
MRPASIIAVFIFLVMAAFFYWYFASSAKKQKDEGPKQQPLVVSKHSSEFNQSLEDMLTTYDQLTESFVQWDSSAVDQKAAQLRQKLDALHTDEMKKDTTGIFETAESFTTNAKTDVQTIETEKDLTAKRHALNSLTENLYNYLRVVKYDRSRLYLQECPMAFNDVEPGIWLSRSPEIQNPYLGLHHPRYGKGMLSCGETKETLNYTGQK